MKTLFSLLILCFGSILLVAQDAPAATAVAATEAAGEVTETAAGLYNQGLKALKAKDYTNGYDLLMKSIDMADPEKDADVLKLAKANGSKAAYYAGNADTKAGNHDAALHAFEMGALLYTCRRMAAAIAASKA